MKYAREFLKANYFFHNYKFVNQATLIEKFPNNLQIMSQSKSLFLIQIIKWTP